MSFVPKIAPKIPLSLPVLQEVNAFSRLNLEPSRTATTACFSNPVMDAFLCHPSDENAKSPNPNDPYCAIHWICKVYFAARLGVGIPEGGTYDFEKSKNYARKLTYSGLVKAIKAKLKGEPEPAGLELEAVAEATEEDKKILEEKKAEEPAKKVVAPKQAPSTKVASPPKVETKPETANGSPAPSTGSVPAAYQPGSMGHFILSQLQTTTTVEKLWALVEAKGWKSKPRFDKQLAAMTTEGRIKIDGGNVSAS
jgi:hypothetical protein